MPKIRILLADDHAIVRAGIRKVVEELPEVEVAAEAGSGPELFSLLEQAAGRGEVFDALLVDLMMPDFEPISAVYAIRAVDASLKILVVSAHNDDFYVQGLFTAGVDGYHLKDQPLSDLKLALERVLAGERWISGPLIPKLIAAPKAAATPVPAAQLTIRQRDILRLLRAGFDNQAIANEMGLSVKTVENHLTRLYKQLKVQSRLEAVNFANSHPELLGVTGLEISSAPPDSSFPRGISILLVDDNTRYLRQLQRILGKVYPQARLYEAESIVGAVQLAQRLKPQLVFVDVVLGEEDGIRCARRVKNVSPQSRIVTISAYPDREFHRLSLEAGAVAFLDKKDLDAVTLQQVISDVIG